MYFFKISFGADKSQFSNFSARPSRSNIHRFTLERWRMFWSSASQAWDTGPYITNINERSRWFLFYRLGGNCLRLCHCWHIIENHTRLSRKMRSRGCLEAFDGCASRFLARGSNLLQNSPQYEHASHSSLSTRRDVTEWKRCNDQICLESAAGGNSLTFDFVLG